MVDMANVFMHTHGMKRQYKLVLVAGLSLALCIFSAVIASSMGESSSDGRPNWDSLGTSIWLTILVTVPAFCVFLVAVTLAVVEYMRSNKSK